MRANGQQPVNRVPLTAIEQFGRREPIIQQHIELLLECDRLQEQRMRV